MCFIYDDYDWIASVAEESAYPVLTPTRCEECGRTIQPGETVHHVFMQQYEECHACEEAECGCADCEANGCQCEAPDFGETSDYDRCEECDKFLRAVEAAEHEAGCDGSESRPGLGNMIAEIRDAGVEDVRRYVAAAIRLFPELKVSGYLGRICRKLLA